MKKRNLITFAFASLTIMLASCNAQKSACAEKQFNGEFKVISINKTNVGASEVEPFINFNWEEKRMNGSAGCNSFFTSFSIGNDNDFTMTNIGATRRMCPDMKVEDAFLEALNQVKSYKACGKTIRFYNSDKEEIIQLKRK